MTLVWATQGNAVQWPYDTGMATQGNAVQWPYDTGMGNTKKCCAMAL